MPIVSLYQPGADAVLDVVESTGLDIQMGWALNVKSKKEQITAPTNL